MNEKVLEYLIARESMVATFGIGAVTFLVPVGSFIIKGVDHVASQDDFLNNLMADSISIAILVLLALCAPALGMVMKQMGVRAILWLHWSIPRWHWKFVRWYHCRICESKLKTTPSSNSLDYASFTFSDVESAKVYVISVAGTTGGLGFALLTGSLVTILIAIFSTFVVSLWAVPLLSGIVGLLLVFVVSILVRLVLAYIRLESSDPRS